MQIVDFKELNENLTFFLKAHKILFQENSLDKACAKLCQEIGKRPEYKLVSLILVAEKSSFYVCSDKEKEHKLGLWFKENKEKLEKNGCPIEKYFQDNNFLEFTLANLIPEINFLKDILNVEIKKIYIFPLKIEDNYQGVLLLGVDREINQLKISLYLNFIQILTLVVRNYYFKNKEENLHAKIKKQETYIQKLFSQMPLGVIYVELPERSIGFVNDYFCKLLGYKKEELEGKSSRILYFSEEEFLEFGDKVYPLLESRDYLNLYSLIFRTKNNQKVEVNLTISAEREQGKLKSVMAFVQDVSFRKEVLNQLNEAVVILDREKRTVVDLNKRCLELFEVGYLEVLNQRIDRKVFYDFRDRDFILEKINQDQEINNYEMLMRSYKGRVFTGLLSVKKVFWEGSEYLLILIRDISEFKALQNMLGQAQKMESLGLLAGGIAHDFNNILTIILGFAELGLKHLQDSNRVKKYLENILTTGDRSKKLIQQLLTFSRQKMGEDRYPLEVSPVIKEQLKLLRDTLPSIIDLRESISSQALVRTNPTELQQILLNLVTNAYQALQKTGGIIEVSLVDVKAEQGLREEDFYLPSGNYVCLVVEDNGPGIPSEYLPHIFEPFFTTKKQGTGMGLAIVASIVKGIGGYFWANNKKEGGAIFKIYLPVFEEVGTGIKTEEQTSFKKLPKELPGLNVLLVDDIKEVLEVTTYSLQELGLTVNPFQYPREALDFFEKNYDQIDLAILDLSMPEINGKELALKFRGIKPQLPIIFLTGYTDLLDEQEAKELQALFLQKPIKLEELEKNILLLLGGK